MALNIMQFKEKCIAGEISLRASVKKDDPTAKPRYFWNIKGVNGSPMLMIGDATRPSDCHPVILRKPAPHEDSGPDATGWGAFTGIIAADEQEAWAWVQNWIYEQIHALKVLKGKKYEDIEEVKREVGPLVLLPQKEDDKVCIWQKLQLGTKFPELTTRFFEVTVVDGALKKKKSYDPNTLDKAQNFFTLAELGELKKSQGKWRSMLYVRAAMRPPTTVRPKPKVTFGGMTLDYDAPSEDEDEEEEAEHSDTPPAAKTGKTNSVSGAAVTTTAPPLDVGFDADTDLPSFTTDAGLEAGVADDLGKFEACVKRFTPKATSAQKQARDSSPTSTRIASPGPE